MVLFKKYKFKYYRADESTNECMNKYSRQETYVRKYTGIAYIGHNFRGIKTVKWRSKSTERKLQVRGDQKISNYLFFMVS